MADVTEAERSRVISLLTRHCGDGRLTLDELEDRIGEVYAATTTEELRHALRELPSFRDPAPEPDPEPIRAPRRDAIREPIEVVDLGRRAHVAPAARCGGRGVGVPCVFLVPVIVMLFVTSHIILGTLLLFFVLPRRSRKRDRELAHA